ncbi:MAG: dehydrogenase, partial [Candidatus Omnitrophica bacterium]|nr:dehydrogenase [Candidatus Omnitrophota bacterium]
CADHVHWASGEIWTDVQKGMSDATNAAGGGHAHCGMMIYQGDNWPDIFRDTVVTVNLHGHRLNNDRLERSGSGYVGKHNPDLFFCSDPWFRGIELIYGPDGGVYLADWTDIGECHESDGVHRSSGRIFKLTYGAPNPKTNLDLSSLSSNQLVNLQLEKNEWYCRRARRLLQERAVSGEDLSSARTAFMEMYKDNPDATRRLRAMWCLYSMGAIDEGWLIDQLADPNEHIRVWAIRFLTDGIEPSADAQAAFRVLAEKDPSDLVRLFVASSLQRMALGDRWAIANRLCAHGEDASDHNLPLMIWYGIVDAVANQPEQALRLASQTKIPIIREFIVRRLAADLSSNPQVLEEITQLLVDSEDPATRSQVLKGLQGGLAGFSRVQSPPSWDSWIKQAEQSGDKNLIERTRSISALFGEGRAIEDLIAIARDGNQDPKSRAEAIRFLAPKGREDIGPLLLDLVNDRAVAVEAAKGLAYYDLPKAPNQLLARYKGLGPEYRKAAIATLASRPSYAEHLVSVLEKGDIPPEDVSAYCARQIVSLGNEDLTQRFEAVWGTVRQNRGETRQLVESCKARLNQAVGSARDLESGKQ